MTERPWTPTGQGGYFYSPPRRSPPAPFPPWRVWEALVVVGLFSASQPLSSVLASLAMEGVLAPHLPPAEAERAMLRLVLPIVIAVSHGLGWLGAFWVVVLRHRQAFLQGLRLTGLRRFRRLRIFVAGMALQVVAVVLAALLPPPEEFTNPMLRFVGNGPWAVAVLFLMAVVMAPFLEEVLFRGMLFPALRRRWRFTPAALAVTVLFTALHGVQTGGYLPALVAIAATGYALAWLREASQSLWPCVLFHMGFNFTALLPVLLLGDRLRDLVPAAL